MIHRRIQHLALSALVALCLLSGLPGNTVQAGTIYWTDWQSANFTNGFVGQGTITTPTSTVSVTYTNPQGIGFFQNGSSGEIDYWQNGGGGRNPATSPYTSSIVSNIPTGTDMI